MVPAISLRSKNSRHLALKYRRDISTPKASSLTVRFQPPPLDTKGTDVNKCPLLFYFGISILNRYF